MYVHAGPACSWGSSSCPIAPSKHWSVALGPSLTQPRRDVHGTGSPQQHLELDKGAKNLGGVNLEAQLGQVPGSKADGCKGSLGSEEE